MEVGLRRLTVLYALLLLFSVIGYSQTCPGSAGSLDATFNGTGTVVLPPGLGISKMVQQGNGKIVALLAENDPSTSYVNGLVRLNSDGSVDSTFGNGGYVFTTWDGSGGGQRAFSLAFQTIDGEDRFVIAGGTPCGRNNCFRAERYTGSGSLDPGFGISGVATVPVRSVLFAMVQPADQKLVFSTADGSLLRLNANGTLDSTFGISGVSVASGLGSTNALAAQADGRFLLAASYTKAGQTYMAAARYNADGTLDDGSRKDTTKSDVFGTAGLALVSFSQGSATAFSIKIDQSGRVVLGGVVTPSAGAQQRYGAIARLTPSGQVDTSFGQSGRSVLRVGSYDTFDVIAIQSNGKIVAGGSSTDSSGATRSDLLTARYTSQGLLDQSYGGLGWERIDLWGGDNGASRGQNTIVMQNDILCGCERIVIGGFTSTVPADMMQSYPTFFRFSE